MQGKAVQQTTQLRTIQDATRQNDTGQVATSKAGGSRSGIIGPGKILNELSWQQADRVGSRQTGKILNELSWQYSVHIPFSTQAYDKIRDALPIPQSKIYIVDPYSIGSRLCSWLAAAPRLC